MAQTPLEKLKDEILDTIANLGISIQNVRSDVVKAVQLADFLKLDPSGEGLTGADYSLQNEIFGEQRDLIKGKVKADTVFFDFGKTATLLPLHGKWAKNQNVLI